MQVFLGPLSDQLSFQRLKAICSPLQGICHGSDFEMGQDDIVRYSEMHSEQGWNLERS